jgi:group I intron endonuclease
MYGVIYKVVNSINGHFYIGQTKMRLSARWSKHKQDSRQGKGWILAAAIRKHGDEAFALEVIEVCESKDSLNAAEIKHIAFFRPQYNACSGGGGLGSPTEEVRLKISRAGKGRKISEQTRARMSAAQDGHAVAPETSAKIQASLAPYYEALRKLRVEKYGQDKRIRTPRKYISPLEAVYVEAGVTTRNEKIALAATLGYKTGTRKRLSGADNPMFGKKQSATVLIVLSEKNTGAGNPFYGHLHTATTRDKMKAAHASRAPVTCPHCGKMGHPNAMKRWHFDNCRSK